MSNCVSYSSPDINYWHFLFNARQYEADKEYSKAIKFYCKALIFKSDDRTIEREIVRCETAFASMTESTVAVREDKTAQTPTTKALTYSTQTTVQLYVAQLIKNTKLNEEYELRRKQGAEQATRTILTFVINQKPLNNKDRTLLSRNLIKLFTARWALLDQKDLSALYFTLADCIRDNLTGSLFGMLIASKHFYVSDHDKLMRIVTMTLNKTTKHWQPVASKCCPLP